MGNTKSPPFRVEVGMRQGGPEDSIGMEPGDGSTD